MPIADASSVAGMANAGVLPSFRSTIKPSCSIAASASFETSRIWISFPVSLNRLAQTPPIAPAPPTTAIFTVFLLCRKMMGDGSWVMIDLCGRSMNHDPSPVTLRPDFDHHLLGNCQVRGGEFDRFRHPLQRVAVGDHLAQLVAPALHQVDRLAEAAGVVARTVDRHLL